MRLSNHKKAILALILANFIWGAASPIFKWSLTNIHPFTLAFLRFFIPTLILFPFAATQLKVKREHWLNLFLLAIFGITLNISFYFMGLEKTDAINAPMIATSGPIFLLICCLLFLKEKINRKIVSGTLIGFLGVLLIILQPFLEKGHDGSIVGNLFLVIATIAGVLHIVHAKKIMPYYSATTVTFWAFLIGSLTFLPMLVFESQRVGFLPNLSLPGIVGIVFGAIFSSLIGYFVYHWSIKTLFAQEVGIFAYIDPIIAVIIAIPLLGEIPTPIYVLGSIFVFAGIFIAEGRLPYHPLHKWREH
ncbi:MAG: DMT family transporter [Candidatus Levybacteria bacterium]|nr:DMT family transporter [Candidatus Levybacteria bacterium]